MVSTRSPHPAQDRLGRKFIRYRGLIFALVARDLKLRYRGSALGLLWTLLNPLLFMGVYTLVFSVYFRINIPNYPVFLLSGLLPWLWFSSSIQQGTGSIVDGSTFIGRTLLPSEILPVASILTNMMNFIFSLPLLLIFLTLFRVDLGWSLLTLPVIMLPQLLLSLGLVFLIATYNVFFRDLQYLITHLLTLLFFTVPIIYPLSYIPDRIRPIVEWNPLTVLAQSYQGIFFHNYFPDWWRLGYVTLLALAICWLGQRAFDRHKDAFAEYI